MGIPDEQIFPHATGAAEKTVADHQEPQELVFYSGWRAWIALEEKGIPYQYKEVNPYKKEAHFLGKAFSELSGGICSNSLAAINPKGLVPAIEYKGKALYESLIICEFFEDAYPSYKPNLLPLDPFDRAIARIWLDHISKAVVPSFHRILQAQDVEKQAVAREELNEAFRKVAKEVKGPYFFGLEFSLVDVAIAPWITRDYIIEENRGYKRSDVSDVWVAYTEEVLKRDSVIKTISLKEHYAEIYGRYLRDEAQSEAAKAIRAGRVIP
ncbi:glutathione-S-transferase [Crucibulum laeve]|uniref:Glutathione-S-transferase n=1 Tax=Crucibulum laeve TaxID=68775 RepID=A0A5C3MHV5_9AGAR|nr:glutathione-S-transferase [Crucibulum laeve]